MYLVLKSPSTLSLEAEEGTTWKPLKLGCEGLIHLAEKEGWPLLPLETEISPAGSWFELCFLLRPALL